jgi:hypothetical protein
MTRILDFADGFTSASNPTDQGISATELTSHAGDAAYVTAHGTAADGDLYYDTVTNKVRIYENGAWVENASFEA